MWVYDEHSRTSLQSFSLPVDHHMTWKDETTVSFVCCKWLSNMAPNRITTDESRIIVACSAGLDLSTCSCSQGSIYIKNVLRLWSCKMVSNKDIKDQELWIYSVWRHHSVICKYHSLFGKYVFLYEYECNGMNAYIYIYFTSSVTWIVMNQARFVVCKRQKHTASSLK